MNLNVEQCGLVPYRRAYERQMQLVERLHRDPETDPTCLILEHPPVFTIGRNGSRKHVSVEENFLQSKGIEVIRVERGGEVTYHGPGQIVCYPIVNLRRSGLSVVDFVRSLEQVMLNVVQSAGIDAARDPRNHGIWVQNRKLGSVGIAIRHGITYHGLALNVDPDLVPFGWINPCGLSEVSMSSMAGELQVAPDSDKLQQRMIEELGRVFSCTIVKSRPTAETAGEESAARRGKPKWLKKRLPSGSDYEKTRRLVTDSKLHTVCQEARCPNQFECFGKGTATFMIMGERCTRNCRFCAVSHAPAEPLDPAEPERVAAAAADMALDYVVLTSVTRDDLPDGGASHFVKTMQAIKKRQPQTLIEILIPDLQGDESALKILCARPPAVLNHNIETVARLYSRVRPQAGYRRSLDLLEKAKQFNPDIITKSGLMVGLGETREELVQTMNDIRTSGCDLLTLGQYLQPTSEHLPVKRFVPPEEFEQLQDIAYKIGFKAVAAGPHVRSSYRAGYLFRQACERETICQPGL